MSSMFAHKSVLSMGSDDVLLREIDACVSVWSRQCGQALLSGSIDDYYTQKNQISTLQEWRRRIEADSNHKFSSARESAIKLIEAQRQLDESFSIPRLDDGELVTTEMGLSIHHLLRLHRFMQERLVEGAFLPSSAKEQFQLEATRTEEMKASKAERSVTSGPSHLLVEMQMAMFKISEPYSIYFSLYIPQMGFVTEEFLVSQTELGLPEDTSLMQRLYTLFANVNTDDVLEQGYIVMKIYRKGCLQETDKAMSLSTSYQRPFACGVFELKSVSDSLLLGVQKELEECQIYRPKQEASFSQVHELLIQKRFAELEEIPMSRGIKLCLCLVQGEIANFKDLSFLEKEYSDGKLRDNLRDAPITMPVRYEEMVLDESMVREAIYITLKGGEFHQGSKSAARNIEITACCVNNSDGTVIPNCISRGVGKQAKFSSTFISTVYYHNNSPSIDETFCINLAAVPNILACHLLVTAAHCSSNTKEKSSKSLFGSKDKKARDIFSFCYLPFSNDKTGGLVIPDGDVLLQCYNPLEMMDFSDFVKISASPGSAYLDAGLKPRTLKNGSIENVSLSTYVHSTRYVQVKAVNDLMNWRNCESDSDLCPIMVKCGSLREDILGPCVQECIEMALSIMHEKSGDIDIGEESFNLYTKLMSILIDRMNDPSRKTVSFFQLPTPGGRGEKVHRSSYQEKTHQKTQKNKMDSFIGKIFGSTVSAEILLLRYCGLALSKLRNKMKNAGYVPSLDESSLVATVRDTCLLAHYNFRRKDTSLQSETLSQLSSEMKNIIYLLNEILSCASKDSRVMVEIRQQFFELLSISEPYLSISDNAAAANQFILTLLGDSFSRSKTVPSDRMKFIRKLVNTNMFLEIEGRHPLLPTISKIIVENLSSKRNVDVAIDLLQLVLEQMEVLGSPSENCELLPILPELVSVMLDQCHRLSNEGAGSAKINRKSVTKKEAVRRVSCIGNTASVTTNTVRISLENSTCCLCSLLNILGKENVTKVMTGEHAVFTRSRISSAPISPSSNVAGKLTVSKSLRVLSLDDDIYEDSESDDQKRKKAGKDFIVSLLSIYTIVVKHLVIPKPWLLLSMLVVTTIQSTIEWSTEVLVSSAQQYIEDITDAWLPSAPEFVEVPLLFSESSTDTKRLANSLTVWSGIFTIALTLALEPEITLESPSMNPARLAYLRNHYDGDLRVPIVQSLSQCWECLPNEGLRIAFGGSFTVPFLALACSSCPQLASTGKRFVIDLLRSDFVSHQCFSTTGSHIYDTVSETLTHTDNNGGNKGQSPLIMERRFLPSYQPLVDFVGDFSKIFSSDDILNCKYALDFSIEINELKTLLQVLSKYPKTTEFEEERSFAYSKLMEFLSKMNRRDAYIKFGHTLAKEMSNFENYVEAANAILLHAKLLNWTDESIVETLDFGEDGIVPLLPSKPAWERKLNLLEIAIDLMDQGKAWEYCIELLKEIGDLYANIRPDYVKLALILQDQAKWYQRIAAEERFFPTMFRVSYYGRGYEQQSLVNKTFIYRGNPLESIMDFTNRIKKKHPGCELLPPKVDPSEEEHLSTNKKFLQVSKVSSAHPGKIATVDIVFISAFNFVITEDEMLGIPAPDSSSLPKYIKSHRQSNEVTCFFYQRPFRKNKVKSANEFLDLWVEKKFLMTSVSFPGHTRRAEVTQEKVTVLNPIEMAVIGLEERNDTLREESELMQSLEDRTAAQSYTMSLSGTVDAAVNGGIKNYESFITGSYREDNPEIAADVDSHQSTKGDLIDRLKKCLIDQIELLQKGIAIHSKKCLESMIPLHSHVNMTFDKMKKELQELLDANT